MNIFPGQRQLPLFFLTCFVLVFAISLRGEFVYDDVRVIEENPFLRNPSNALKLLSSDYFAGSQEMTFRPVVTASYFLDHMVWGLRPFGFRLHNLLLHLAVCALLWHVLWDVARSKAAAWWGTFLFCFHPMQVEAVAVPGLREDLQCAMFLLLGWLALQRGKHLLLIMLCYALALFSKETALIFPAMVIVAMTLEKHGEENEPLPRGTALHGRLGVLAGLGAISIGYVWLRFFAYRSPMEDNLTYIGGSLWTSLLTHAGGMTWAALCLILPPNISVDPWLPVLHNFWDTPVLICGFLVLAIAWALLRSLRRNRQLALGLTWFAGALIPSSGIVPLANVYADRYLYVPMIGLAIAFAAWFSRVGGKGRKRLAPLLIVYVAILGVLTHQRIALFHDNATLWGDALLRLGHKPWPLSLLSERQPGQDPVEILQRRTASDPHNPDPWRRLGAAHFVRSEYGQAAQAFEKALKITPHPDTYLMLGDVYCNLNRLQEAQHQYERALALNPHFPEAHNNLGVLFLNEKNYARAVTEFQSAIALRPDFADAFCNLATAMAQQGRQQEAIALWQKTLRINPRHAPARWNLMRLENTRSVQS